MHPRCIYLHLCVRTAARRLHAACHWPVDQAEGGVAAFGPVHEFVYPGHTVQFASMRLGAYGTRSRSRW